MRSRNMRQIIFCCFTTLLAVALAQTPVIGGVCKLGTADVQIGGKQTQFFLKCEPTSDSQNGEGVWVVKSRNVAAHIAPVENTQQNMSPPKKNANPNICEQDNGARENDACAVSATCLQANNGYPTTYLQCDQTNMRWMRKSCQDTFIFNFEQQTCIVPKSQSSLRQLCLDGSTSRFKCPCPVGYTCNRQGFCCSNHIPSCMQTCSNTKPCPNGMLCSKTTSCCQPKTHLARSDPTEIFAGDSTIFDMGGQKLEKIPPQPPNGFRVMSGSPSNANSLDLANEHSWSMPDRTRDEAVEGLPPEIRPPAEQPQVAAKFLGSLPETEVPSRTRPPMQPIPTTSTNSPMMACRGTNAVCDYDTDCPSSFLCEENCCRLQTCPNTMKVQYTCTSNYQCGSGESCLFGGCCLRRPLTSTTTTTTTQMPTRMLRTETAPTTSSMASLAVIEIEPVLSSNEDTDPYSEMMATEKPLTSTRMTSMMPSFGPTDVCELDHRVSNCNMASPCPETSECLFGSCCRVTPRTCSNGLPALAVPDICTEADECPISSVCEQGRCCPLDNAAEDLPLPKSFSQINSLKTVEISKKKKNICLTSQTCSSIILCPPAYTCSSTGECCQLNITCPDGTVPETVCGKEQLCPSSVHSCMNIGTESVCCPNNDKGQQPAGLVCTFSSCSNNNPCSSGTCNNGYCCSAGGAPPPIVDNTDNHNITESTSNSTSTLTTTPKAETNTTHEVLSGHEDWPVGPPGYGFPEHLADLDSVLVPAQGDGNSCSGGYKSNLACSLGGECPPGLFCDRLLDRCCPMVLPLTDTRNPTKVQPSRRPPNDNEQDESMDEEYRDRKRSYRSFGGRGTACCPFQANPGCNGCQPQAAPMLAISTCPGGAYPIGNCNSGYCSPGYQCVSNSCCPQYAPQQPQQQQIRVFSCPTGGNAVGACIAGSCATGYSCVQGNCCPARETKNPFVCPDGAQAVGGCVNGQCGAGYRCTNGLCCAGTSTTIKCLDGSEAVGACIPSCQGDACGRTTISYYCGAGYTCTTGNICCAINSCPDGGDPIGPTINGLCPTGYVAQGSICCSAVAALCPDGSASTPTINGQCPATLTLTNGVCCANTALTAECVDEISIGPCVNGGCSGNLGYVCDAAQEKCCPVVKYEDVNNQLGPAVGGLCPGGYAVVYIPGGDPDGVCVSLQSIPGICNEDVQSGPCSDTGACQTGFFCFTSGGVCCPNVTFRKFKPVNKAAKGGVRPIYGRPLHSYMPPRTMGGPMSCPDGSAAGGACMNGLCGVGHECIEGLCCLPQSKYGVSQQGSQDLKSTCPGGETAVSGCFADGTCGTGYECVKHMNLCCPPGSNISPSIPSGSSFPGQPATSVRPIGARCMQDVECVGNAEGLSMCHAGVCQCSPIAYSQGIACIRRRAMQMMMNDSPVMDSEVEKAVEKNLVAPVPTA